MSFQNTPVFPRICVGPARAKYIGPSLKLAPHLNLTTTIAVSLADKLLLRTWTRSQGWSEWQSSAVALIPPKTLHHLVGGGNMAFLYCDPLGQGRSNVSQAQLLGGREQLLRETQAVGLQSAFEAFGLLNTGPADKRIAKVLLEIERRPDDFPSLQDAAAISCLSPSRFRARFVDELGLPYRRFRLWRRMAAAVRAVAKGSNLTEAAFQAGFSSAAHFSSTFKQMFGISASQVLAMGVRIDVSEDGHLDA